MTLKDFFCSQIAKWDGKGSLGSVETRRIGVGRYYAVLQHNPARIVSAAAKTDSRSIRARKCFLCGDGRLPKQDALPIELAGEQFDILVNPYPILPCHFTIAAKRHVRQSLHGRISAFAELLERFPGLTVFYNGSRSGASAPDHLHFQASLSGNIPLQMQWKNILENSILSSKNRRDGGSGESLCGELLICEYLSPLYAVVANSPEGLTALATKVFASMPVCAGDYEPRLNIVAWRDGDTYNAAIIPRCSHRPECYFLDGDRQIMVSPGALDMAGLVVTPRHDDFLRITPSDLSEIMGECGGSAVMPLAVGIMSAGRLDAGFTGGFLCGGTPVDGKEEFCARGGKVLWRGQLYGELLITPQSQEAVFSLGGVEIGTQFHWQQRREETFRGSLRIITGGQGELIAINIVDTETYLESVVGSEMSATSPMELLKAHAVISRSWVMAQVCRGESATTAEEGGPTDAHKRVVWYDHEAHTLFDVCADDHCQRYQGIPNESAESAARAVRATRGETLTYKGEIADARFSKCCGGATELFSYCWADEEKPYLPAQADIAGKSATFRPLHAEADAADWIMSRPKTLCGMGNSEALMRSLNAYDQSTSDYYRWTVSIGQGELQRLLKEKIGFSGGNILSLDPLQRGASGRISLLRINAEHTFIIIGKELEIRRALSETHLLSSAFVVEYEYGDGDTRVPETFILHGAGWGHGVGLCQIGAAQMAIQGSRYREILGHYYRCDISRLW